MSYLKYSPLIEDLEKIKYHYWEIWQGLPDLEFEPAKSRMGDTLRYYKGGNYIFVPTNALSAYKKNPQTIYIAMMGKVSRGKIHTIWLTPQQSSLEDAINKAIKLNEKEIRLDTPKRHS